LQQLAKEQRDDFAQRLATQLIAPQSNPDVSAASREAACRWAGRQQLWSMLALASEGSEPATEDPTRTIAIERLFAESLMQTGRLQDSRKWWVHLVDHHNADDFPTLLRCAETATSLAEVQEAHDRIEAVRAACGEDAARNALVDMLSADLAIRRLRFDQARSILEGVIQSAQSVATLRGRAQWMIGETYFLQHKFAEAIEAYRRVEGVQPGGPWAVAALIQAGKSFEQLGRTREAAVCYSSLVSRFADSQHAAVARRRLAAIAPTSSSPESKSPSETIRR
jgi:tetratricopeptide (TPR) repeat protein